MSVAEEEGYLQKVLEALDGALTEADQRLEFYAGDIQKQKEYLWSNRDEMDHLEKIAARESIQQAVSTGDNLLERKRYYLKLKQSPYFGRFDFAFGSQQAEAFYIGVHHFYDDASGQNLVYDWRAPVASLFYDYEIGPACYQSPEGEIAGEITGKRQFRIKQGKMELMLDTTINVMDELLQEELGRAADDGMRNIVATIQRDQNAIIRDDRTQVLIIQGVAGSGKTSIALHRIAFLLYRFKDTLTSQDILIISPNRVFADYIANVLPELGEEEVREMGMEQLADELLEGNYRFQSFFEQTAQLIEKKDDSLKERLVFKASTELLTQLNLYASHLQKQRFVGEDVWVAKRLMPGWLLEEIFQKHTGKAPTERLNQVAREAEQKIGIQYHYDLQPEERKQLKEAVKKMYRKSTLRQDYIGFYDWLGRPELFKLAGNKLEYADVFPLIYLKMQLEGIRSDYQQVKHLLIDEMQDYTPIQYAVLARLFPCKKTILGDAHQSVNPFSASNAEKIRSAFMQANCVTLNKSYRSSYEITRFAQRISPNPDLIAIERHGEEPQVLMMKNKKAEVAFIVKQIQNFRASDHRLLAIICKTQKQARQLHKSLEAQAEGLQLLSDQSQQFRPGVLVCSATLAKGLEFDRVILPEVTAENYQDAMDRNLLYVGVTRAMHQLLLTCPSQPSAFIARD